MLTSSEAMATRDISAAGNAAPAGPVHDMENAPDAARPVSVAHEAPPAHKKKRRRRGRKGKKASKTPGRLSPVDYHPENEGKQAEAAINPDDSQGLMAPANIKSYSQVVGGLSPAGTPPGQFGTYERFIFFLIRKKNSC